MPDFSAAAGCYRIGPVMLPWHAAEAECQEVHDKARLVAIASAREQSAIEDWWNVQPGDETF